MTNHFRDYFLAESIGATLFALLFVVGFVIYALLPIWTKDREDETEDETEDKYRSVRKIVKTIFPFVKRDTSNGGKKHDTKIFKYKVQEWYLAFLMVMILFIIVVTVVIFWHNFFIERSSSCNPYDSFDCFEDKVFWDIFNDEPLNCSTSSMDENNDVQCFRFTCNIGNAVGLATGAFAFSWVTATALLWIILQCGDLILKEQSDDDNNNNKCCKPCCTGCLRRCSCITNYKWFYFFCILLFQVFTTSCALGLFSFTGYLHIDGKVSLTCYYSVSTFGILIMIASITPWCCIFKRRKLDITTVSIQSSPESPESQSPSPQSQSPSPQSSSAQSPSSPLQSPLTDIEELPIDHVNGGSNEDGEAEYGHSNNHTKSKHKGTRETPV